MSQNLSELGAVFLRTEEGFSSTWYADIGGVGTIGPGLTWQSSAFREWWGRARPGQKFGPGATMTKAESDRALTFVFAAEFAPPIRAFFGRDVGQNIFDGVGSTIWNAGAAMLRDKWALALKAGDVETAATLLKSDRITAKNTGKIIAGLKNRRREEAELIQFGDYTVGAYVPGVAGNEVLERGERGTAVFELQQLLAAIKLYTGKLDGIFGYGTEAAVLAFQRGHALVADGYAGPKTMAALKSFAKAA